ncbi:MAG TPA: DUF4411 family protein [bacterium]|nr:DUF4411 family protein [bacterium]
MVIENAVYILDADVFIRAARDYYAFDINPQFWEKLVLLAEAGRIASVDKVKLELDRGNDALKQWVNQRFSKAFKSCDDEEVTTAFADTMKWVNAQQQFAIAAKSDYASKADGWLVAYAKAKDCVIVTQEKYAREVRNRVPIPNICKAFDVTCVDTFEMLRNLGVVFL